MLQTNPPVESYLTSLLSDGLAQAVASLGGRRVLVGLVLSPLLPHFLLKALDLHL